VIRVPDLRAAADDAGEVTATVPRMRVRAAPEADGYVTDFAPATLAASYLAASPATVRHRERWLVWDGAGYSCVDDATVAVRVRRHLAGCYTLHKGNRKPLVVRISTVRETLAAMEAADPVLLDSNVGLPIWSDGTPISGLLPVRGGLLDLASGELRPATPDAIVEQRIDIPWDPDATCPNWIAFLLSLWPDDLESIELLQDWFGYTLCERGDHQKALMITGPKRCGKGTILRTLQAIHGPSYVGVALDDLGARFGLETATAARVLAVSDAREGARLEQRSTAERILNITGQDSIQIDRKYKPVWRGTLEARMVLVSNVLPSIADAAGVLASRFLLLRIVPSFAGREDLELRTKLATELPGILRWAVTGWRRLRQRGHFREPAASSSDRAQLRHLERPILRWAEDHVRWGATEQCERQAAYVAWRDWAVSRGYPASSDGHFGRALRALAAEHGVELCDHRPGTGSRVRMYLGMSLTSGLAGAGEDGEDWRT